MKKYYVKTIWQNKYQGLCLNKDMLLKLWEMPLIGGQIKISKTKVFGTHKTAPHNGVFLWPQLHQNPYQKQTTVNPTFLIN